MVISKSGAGYMLADFNFIFWAKDGTAPRASTRAAINTNNGNLRIIFFPPFLLPDPGADQTVPGSGFENKIDAFGGEASNCIPPDAFSLRVKKTRPSKRFCF
jgi:hypothetical protein